MSDAGSTGRGRHAAAETSDDAAEVAGEYTETESSEPRDTSVEGEYVDTDGAAPISSTEKGSYVDTETNTESGPDGEYTDTDQ